MTRKNCCSTQHNYARLQNQYYYINEHKRFKTFSNKTLSRQDFALHIIF